MSYEKSIELYGDGIGRVDYVESMGSDLTIVNSARVSFGTQKEELDGRDRKLINYLAKHKHTSTFEHNVVTFRFTVPLYVRSQHHRHRTWSYNEISRRYTDVNINFYEPEGFRTQHESNRQASNPDELIDPNMMKDAGVCREQARGVLPQNLYTEYYGTVNLSNLLKFIDLRSHEGAQWEIQKVAEACLDIADDLWPIAVKAYRRGKNG